MQSLKERYGSSCYNFGMKKFLYIVLISALFFVYLTIISSEDLNPVGTALQIWIPLIAVLVVPLSFTTRYVLVRIGVFTPLAIILSYVGVKWTNYSDAGGLIFPYLCFFILIAIIVSHYILKRLS